MSNDLWLIIVAGAAFVGGYWIVGKVIESMKLPPAPGQQDKPREPGEPDERPRDYQERSFYQDGEEGYRPYDDQRDRDRR